MSHVVDMPDVLAEIDHFRAELAKHFIAFDPGDVDEKLLLDRAIAAAKDGSDWIGLRPRVRRPAARRPLRVSVREVLDIAGDIDGQIYMRDFKLIDQSDMICSLIPELPGGIPGLSSGVERELQHAFEHTKEVYVVWKPKKNPSPFITETATKIFSSVDDALTYFEEKGMFAQRRSLRALTGRVAPADHPMPTIQAHRGVRRDELPRLAAAVGHGWSGGRSASAPSRRRSSGPCGTSCANR